MDLKNWKHWAVFALGVVVVVAIAVRIPFVAGIIGCGQGGMVTSTTPPK